MQANLCQEQLRKAGACVILTALPVLAGCINPEFLNQISGVYYPVAPGDEQYVMIRVVNDTTATLDVPIVWDNGTTPTFRYLIRGLSPEGRDTGLLLDWPILRVAVGDLDNPYGPEIVANFSGGQSSGVYFGRSALQANVDFKRGDTIIFQFTADNRSPAYIRVTVGRIDGEKQSAEALRADPFTLLRLLTTGLGF